MEEALWKLEDKWKLTTKQALVVLLTIVSFTAVALGVVTFLKNKKNNKVVSRQEEEISSNEELRMSEEREWRRLEGGPSCGFDVAVIKRVLMASLRWSGAKKWEDKEENTTTPPEPPLLAVAAQVTEEGRQSHNSESPVWQRPILMGDKCELPRFSGLILYDETGHLLSHSTFQPPFHQEEKPAAAVSVTTRTTLRDLL